MLEQPPVSYQINQVLRGSIPFWLTFLLALLTVVPIRIDGFAVISPALVSMSVFYWSLHRPYLMAAPVVFFLGLISDILTGVPLGLSSFMLLIVHGVAVSQRHVFVGKAFILTWWGYLLIATGISMLTWLIACIYSLALMPFFPVLIQLIITVLIFPVFAWCFGAIQHSLLKGI
ncbi:rod shape-determining protein MreD [Sneathiella sp.]|jgi:rod shape-determining protein MreD|uniref:rod shape-determining protein MreD n=1 Tax=Sneathiella sp. TaxID=1964365 RepID=UPI0039E56DFF